MTESTNVFCLKNLDYRNLIMGFTGYLLDFMTLAVLYYLLKRPSFRPLLAIGICHGIRGFIQNNFILARYKGFNYFEPNILSMTVAYHDLSDFYFSGHFGVCTIYLLEFISQKNRVLTYLSIVFTLLEWFMLIITRAHFFIDFSTAVAVAYISHRLAEKFTYFWDVKLFGLRSHQRNSLHFKPCPRCGWCNEAHELFVY